MFQCTLNSLGTPCDHNMRGGIKDGHCVSLTLRDLSLRWFLRVKHMVPQQPLDSILVIVEWSFKVRICRTLLVTIQLTLDSATRPFPFPSFYSSVYFSNTRNIFLLIGIPLDFFLEASKRLLGFPNRNIDRKYSNVSSCRKRYKTSGSTHRAVFEIIG